MNDFAQLSDEQILAGARPQGRSVPAQVFARPRIESSEQPSPLAQMSDADLLDAMKRNSEPVSVAEDVAKSAAVGTAKGGIGMVGMPGDLQQLGTALADWLYQKAGSPKLPVSESFREESKKYAEKYGGRGDVGPSFPMPSSKDIQEFLEQYTGKFYKPKTTAGKYAETAGEFLPAAIGGGGGVVAKTARVAIPAAASETAGQYFEGSKYEPVARFLAALGAGGAVGLLQRPGTTTAAIERQLPDGVTVDMVNKADNLINTAAQRGIDLTWPEALTQVSGRPVLTNMQRHLEASPQTSAKMDEFFGGRPQQVEAAVRREADSIAPANTAPSTIGPAVGRAAEETVNDVRGAINKTAEPFYTASQTIRLTPQEMAKVRAVPGFENARAIVRNDPQLNRYVANLPDDSIGFLNEVKKQLDRSAKDAVGPLNTQPNMQRSAGLSKDAETVRSAATNASTDYATALAVESVGREKYLQPLLDGPIGKIAQKDKSTRDAINALFPKNPLPNSQDEISTAVSAVAKRNPRAASDIVRAHVESVFNEAARDLQTGPNQANGAKFRAALVGNPQQGENMRAAVEALPNGKERWDGFSKLLDVLEATGARQGIGSRTSYNAEINKMQAAGGITGDVAKTTLNPARLGQKFIDRYEQWKLGRDLDGLAGVITDPRSGDLFRALAKAPPNSDAALLIANKLLTFSGPMRSGQIEPPRN